MLELLKNAIEARESLVIDYEPGLRNIEPHAVGVSADGNLLLRAYQVSGASSSGEQVNWKLFRVDRAKSLDLVGQTFNGPRPGYARGDRAMKGGIISQL